MKNLFKNFEVTPDILIPILFGSVIALIYAIFEVALYLGGL